HCRPGGSDQCRPDQDRLGEPYRPHRQIQPASAHRGRPGRRRSLRRTKGVAAMNGVPLMNGRPVVLTILDGWGYSPASGAEGNAIAAANKPNYDRLLREFPNTLVYTSG